MTRKELKEVVWQTNLDLVKHGLVIFTWGNVSAIDRNEGIVAIKPSGISYDDMKPEDMVLLDIEGNVVEGKWKPSSDTATHLALYRAFEGIGGVVHTHLHLQPRGLRPDAIFLTSAQHMPTISVRQFPVPVQ